MLEVFQALAIRLHWLRPVAMVIAVLFGVFFIYAIFAENAPDNHLTTGIIGTLWGLLLLTFLNIFPTVPPLPNPEQSLWQRIKLRLRRSGYLLLMVAVLALTFACVWVTLRLIKVLPV